MNMLHTFLPVLSQKKKKEKKRRKENTIKKEKSQCCNIYLTEKRWFRNIRYRAFKLLLLLVVVVVFNKSAT